MVNQLSNKLLYIDIKFVIEKWVKRFHISINGKIWQKFRSKTKY